MRLDVSSEGATGILVGLDAIAARVDAVDDLLDAASEVVYNATEQWFSSHGEGTWPPLAASTLANKRSGGYPNDPLVETGAFKESVTSASGPYSFRLHIADGVAFGVDWEKGGWQIPVVHFYGTTNAGVDHNVVIPARPAWPAHDSVAYAEMREKLSELILRGL